MEINLRNWKIMLQVMIDNFEINLNLQFNPFSSS